MWVFSGASAVAGTVVQTLCTVRHLIIIHVHDERDLLLQSAGFTGIYGFAIGVAWLLLGVLVTLGACCKLCCCNHARVAERRSAAYYWIPRILALLLSLFAIGVIVTMYIRNRQFHTRAFKVRDTIAGSANDAIGAVRNVTGTLSEVDTITSKYNIPGLNDGILGNTVNQLNSQANNIDRIVGDNIRNLNKIINAMYESSRRKTFGCPFVFAGSVFLPLVPNVSSCLINHEIV